MTKEESQWLYDFYRPRMGYRLDGSTMSWHCKAITILSGTQRNIPSCPCEYKVTATIAQSMYNQHEQQIISVYNTPEQTEEPVKTRGRKKKA